MLYVSRLAHTDEFGQLHGVVRFPRQAFQNLSAYLVLEEVQYLVDVRHASQLEVG